MSLAQFSSGDIMRSVFITTVVHANLVMLLHSIILNYKQNKKHIDTNVIMPNWTKAIQLPGFCLFVCIILFIATKQ